MHSKQPAADEPDPFIYMQEFHVEEYQVLPTAPEPQDSRRLSPHLMYIPGCLGRTHPGRTESPADRSGSCAPIARRAQGRRTRIDVHQTARVTDSEDVTDAAAQAPVVLAAWCFLVRFYEDKNLGAAWAHVDPTLRLCWTQWWAVAARPMPLVRCRSRRRRRPVPTAAGRSR